jgi:hypothetical protein
VKLLRTDDFIPAAIILFMVMVVIGAVITEVLGDDDTRRCLHPVQREITITVKTRSGLKFTAPGTEWGCDHYEELVR